MANMSYCRFQNTLDDMQDCNEALDELVAGDKDIDEVSDEEREAMERMMSLMEDMTRSLEELGIAPRC